MHRSESRTRHDYGSWFDEDEPDHHEEGGPEANERLTAITGATLLALFAAEGFTLLSLHRLLYWHFFLGLLLIGPVTLKIGSTLYRFTRYYTGQPDYRRKGPPAPLLRVLGPLAVLSTVAVIGTGVALAFLGPGSALAAHVLTLHKLSFIGWFGIMTIHVLAYVWRLPGLIGADLPGRRATVVLRGRGLRWLLAVACFTAGVAIALSCVHLVSAWQQLL